MDALAIVVLAAGLGKRMKSDLPKVLHRSIEKTLIEHVLESASSLNPERIVVVTGHSKEKVENHVRQCQQNKAFGQCPILFAWQEEQLGTGHAVKCALKALEAFKGTVLILYGDVPLISPETLVSLLITYEKQDAALALISVISEEQRHYGRVIRDKATGKILRITEAKDCTPEEYQIREVNSGIYAISSELLPAALGFIKNHNSQGEYYLTDIVEFVAKQNFKVSSLTLYDAEELQGVNNLMEISLINTSIKKRRVEKLILEGVQILDPPSLHVDSEVIVEAGAVIGPDVQLKGITVIKKGVVIEGNAYIVDSVIEEGAQLLFGVRIEASSVGANSSIGPFAHLRPGNVIGEDVRVGNFVEIKNSELGNGVKASHLSYLGDSKVGENTNIGAGTITCNFDGQKKNKTYIGKNAFIGSNTCLIAPIEVGDGAYTGAGSVITKDIEENALGISRPELVIKKGWAKGRKRHG